MATQIAFGAARFINGGAVFTARVSEAVTASGTSAAGSGTARQGEVAEVTSTVDIWATVSGTAAAGTTLLIPAGGTKWFPNLVDGATVSVITA